MPSLILYGLIALAIASAFGATYWKGREAGKEVIRAELQPQITACEGREKGLQGQIEVQNRAVASLKAEGDARVKRAQDGLKTAQDRSRAVQAESARLRDLAGKPSGGACPAAEAVKAIRDGLK